MTKIIPPKTSPNHHKVYAQGVIQGRIVACDNVRGFIRDSTAIWMRTDVKTVLHEIGEFLEAEQKHIEEQLKRAG